MKKVIITIVLCFCIFSLFTYAKENKSSDSSYEQGYEDGVNAALSTLRDASNDWERYVKLEDVEDSIYLYYDDNPYVDADLIRDDILYHPDVENYTPDELLEEIIDETTLEK